ncbi:hypothetical protein HK105_207146 [Polyrhizophydium stewartii]|uniref:Uncharacterized protein n=1 Tax=Polyrhizophydium stewartii TaxID=2732419 RepID=A0ABR4N1J3_9FUNG
MSSIQVLMADKTDAAKATEAKAAEPRAPGAKRARPRDAATGPLGASPEFRTNVLVRWTYGWLNPLLRRGFRHPLQHDELWQLDERLTAAAIGKRLLDAWAAELKRPGGDAATPAWRLARTIFAAFGADLVRSAMHMFVQSTLSVGSSVILLYLITWIQDVQAGRETFGDWFGYVMATIIFCSRLLSTMAYNWSTELTTKTGFNARTSLTSALYQKSLRLSAAARQEYSVGKITNIIATDTNRVDISFQYMNMLWAAPYQIIIATALLIWTIGPSATALVGFALIVCYLPFQHQIASLLRRFRRGANVFADKRIKIIQEAMLGIRVVKIYGWEESFQKMMSVLRSSELRQIRNSLIANVAVAGITQGIPTLAMLASFICYSLLGNSLNPAKTFASLSLFYSFRFPLMFLPTALNQSTDAWIALGRISDLLMAQEVENGPTFLPASADPDEIAIEVTDASFRWETPPPPQPAEPAKRASKKLPPPDQQQQQQASSPARPDSPASQAAAFSFDSLTLRIPRGKLVAVVGTVGSGKSSLLNALVGEMRRTAGSLTFHGTAGFCQQQAWIQNASVKDNILFGQPLDAAKYARVVRACALESDLAILPAGDATEIGERGINLSGGQKQRVSIARAVYFDPDIVLLDDPLSAVDSHVGRFLFDECICKALAGKTRVLVTHQLHFLPHADVIVVLDHGKIVAQGSFDELLQTSASFAALMREYGGLGSSDSDSGDGGDGGSGEDKSSVSGGATHDGHVKVEDATGPIVDASKAVIVKAGDTGDGGKKIISTEERNLGAVSWHYYFAYARLGGGVLAFLGCFFMLCLANSSRVMADQWLNYWSSGRFALQRDQYIGGYVGISVFQVFAYIGYGSSVMFFGAVASQSVHDRALLGVFRSPISFFDSAPIGRITSRFSRDIDGVDTLLPDVLRMFFYSFTLTISNFIVIATVFPLFIAPLVPVIFAYYFLQMYYRATSRELKRLDSITRSPLIANVSETLTGLATIRAYNAAARFRDKNDALMDANNRCYYLSLIIPRWIQLRLETLNSALVFLTAVFAIVAKSSVGPGAAGLVITYALQITAVFNWCVKQIADIEINMNAAERLIHYIEELTPEAPDVLPPGAPGASLDASWPHAGMIEVRDAVLRYRADLPPVLHGVSFVVRPGEKVGIVGRTGAGKSTILTSILRLFELESGSIVIDGVDVATLGLRDVRRRIGVIPQEPVLFSGTVRSNLDPFGQYQDSELWDALQRADLKAAVAAAPGGLDSAVAENGDNWSTGQRQLLCLARAILKKARIIMLDEATASVDLATDDMIQRAIRSDFGSSTVLTIAHRLNTIADYDKILVLGAGRVLEFDSPRALLGDPASHFSRMVAETGPSNAAAIRALANGEAAVGGHAVDA